MLFDQERPSWSVEGRDWPNRAHSLFIQSGGLSWHVQQLGDGPPLLLIHGGDDTRVLPRHSLALARALGRSGSRSETHMLDGIGHEGLIMRFARPFLRDRRPLVLVCDFLAQVMAEPASAPVQSAPA